MASNVNVHVRIFFMMGDLNIQFSIFGKQRKCTCQNLFYFIADDLNIRVSYSVANKMNVRIFFWRVI